MNTSETTTTSESATTTASETTATTTVPGVRMVKVKVLGTLLDNGQRGNCIVNGYICRPGLIRRVPEKVADYLVEKKLVALAGL